MLNTPRVQGGLRGAAEYLDRSTVENGMKDTPAPSIEPLPKPDIPDEYPNVISPLSGPLTGTSGYLRAAARQQNSLPPGSVAFKARLDEMWELHRRKANDYGDSSSGDSLANIRASEDFGIPGWLGALLRGNDKIHRLKEYARHQNLANESARDSLIDLACYAVIALVLYDELHSSQSESVNTVSQMSYEDWKDTLPDIERAGEELQTYTQKLHAANKARARAELFSNEVHDAAI